jgi:hypothetical protein
MLALMVDPRFKSMCLVTMFWSRENAIVVVAKYDEKLLLPYYGGKQVANA